MTLHRILEESDTLMRMTNIDAWRAMTPDQRKETLEQAQAIEGRIRELADVHNRAVTKLFRQHLHIPQGEALHYRELPQCESFAELMAEVQLPHSDTCMTPEPDPEAAVRGLPENVAYYYRFAKAVRKQTAILADQANDRHERNRHQHEETETHMPGLA